MFVTVQRSPEEAKALSLYYNALAAIKHLAKDEFKERVQPDQRTKAIYDTKSETEIGYLEKKPVPKWVWVDAKLHEFDISKEAIENFKEN